RRCALCQLLGDGALPLLLLVHALHAQDMPAPVDARAFVVLALKALHQLGELTLVLILHRCQRQGRGGLLVDNRAQASLTLDDSVRHAHLLAEGWKPANQLDGVHVVSNHHHLSLARLHQRGNMVQAILDDDGLLLLRLLAGLTSSGLRLEALSLLLLILRPVLH
ncbi:hypothetical protein Vretifemale_18417, partial [Volvox reticuliferus]